jgi:hypothetical protein
MRTANKNIVASGIEQCKLLTSSNRTRLLQFRVDSYKVHLQQYLSVGSNALDDTV